MDDVPRLSRRAFLRTATLLAATPLLEACRPAPPAPPSAPATSLAESPPTLAPPTLAPTTLPTVENRPEPTNPPTLQPRRGGLITISISSEPTLNPFTWPGQLATQFVARPLWNGLTRYEPGTMRVVPDLATSWTPAPDGLSWTFTLRRSVTWHDGRPFVAGDVKFTLESLLNPKVNAPFRGNLAELSEVQIVDDHTVRLLLEKPYASLPIQLASNVPMTPKHLLEGRDLNSLAEFAQKPVGTGPFKLKESARGSFVSLEAFDDYYEGRPNLDGLLFKVLPEISQQMAQLRRGEVDLAVVESTTRETLKDQPQLSFLTVEQPNTFAFCPNHAREPFHDRAVRLALTLGCNRQQMVEHILRGEAPVAAGPYGAAFGEFRNGDLKPYPYDPDEARRLLAEAGWEPGLDGILEKDGKRLSIGLLLDRGNRTREQLALALLQDWKKIGVNLQIDLQFLDAFQRRGSARPGEYDLRPVSRLTAPDPDKTAEYSSDGALNHYMYSNPEVDQLMAQGRSEPDHQKRVETYHQAQKLIYQDVPIIWVFYPTEIIALNRAIRGFPSLNLRDALSYSHRFSWS